MWQICLSGRLTVSGVVVSLTGVGLACVRLSVGAVLGLAQLAAVAGPGRIGLGRDQCCGRSGCIHGGLRDTGLDPGESE